VSDNYGKKGNCGDIFLFHAETRVAKKEKKKKGRYLIYTGFSLLGRSLSICAFPA